MDDAERALFKSELFKTELAKLKLPKDAVVVADPVRFYACAFVMILILPCSGFTGLTRPIPLSV